MPERMFVSRITFTPIRSLRLLLSDPRYFAPAWIFACLNIVVGTWVLYLPRVKDRLGLDDGQVGLALLSFSLGLFCVIPLSSTLLKRFGLGRSTAVTIVLFAAAMAWPPMAPSYLWLCVGLFTAGMLAGVTDIGMNAMVSELEQRDGVQFMSAAHGFFSLGGVLGAGIGNYLLGVFTSPFWHSSAVAGFILLTTLVLAPRYVHLKSRESDRGEGGKFKFSLIRPLLGLTVLAVIIMGSEGAIEHWSKLYLLDVVRVSDEAVAGYGFVLFSATMALGRFMGDGVSNRFGSLPIIIGGSLLAAGGFGLVLTAELYVALAGFALVGLGFSVIVPELFRLAGRARGVSSAEGISVVAGMGYAGFLASPALLGFVSDLTSLRGSFGVLFGLALVAAGVGVFVGGRRVGG